MRKGVAPVLAVIVLIFASVVASGIYLHYGIRRVETITRTVRETEIFAGINAVEFMKRSLQEALPYTIEQASYDVAKGGGYHSSSATIFKDCIPFWKIYEQIYPPDVEKNLSVAILDLFNCYGKSYGSGYPNIPIFTPDYKRCGDVSMSSSSNSITANVFTKPAECSKRDSTLGVEAPDFYEIYDNADFTDTVGIYTFALFDIGKDFIQDDNILNAIEDADEAMSNVNGKNCKEISLPNICENEDMPVADDVLDQVCPNADQKFKNLIETKIHQLEGDYAGKKLRIEIDGINVNHTGSCSWGVDGESEDCGCKRGHQECPSDAEINNGTHCMKCNITVLPCRCYMVDSCSDIDMDECVGCDKTICVDPGLGSINKICCNKTLLTDCEEAWEFVCDEYYRILEGVKCTYDYYGDAIVLVKIFADPSDNNNKYPIYDESIDWRVLTLRFYVIDGNWKETSPELEECSKGSYC